MPRHPRKLIGLIGTLIFFTYVAGFLAGFVCSVFHVAAPHTEFPLNDAQDVAVDRAGHLYVTVHFYSRVQQYAPDGTFLRGWPVPQHSHLRLDDAGRLQVIDRTHVRTYAPDGSLLSTAPNPADSIIDPAPRATTPAGDTYEVRSRLAFPRVVRTTPDGRTTVVVADPWYRWPVVFPIPGLLLVPLAALLIRLGEGRRQPAAAPVTP